MEAPTSHHLRMNLRKSWSEALKYWKEALNTAKDYGWETGFSKMIIHFSIGQAYFYVDNYDLAFQHNKTGAQLFEKIRRQ